MSLRLGVLILMLLAFVQTEVGQSLRDLKNWIDSADVKGTDTLYVRLPDKGFIAYTNAFLTGTHMLIDYDHATSADVKSNFKGTLHTRAAALFSLACSYRGWGVSYSRDLSYYGDTEWSFTTYGQTYGAEFRYHKSHTLNGELENTVTQLPQDAADINMHDCEQTTLLGNLYYVGNHRRFSMPAAMSHTVIQRRSSGSWLAILNYHYLSTKVDRGAMTSVLGFEVIKSGLKGRSRLDRLRQSQVSIGGGYAYNYVFGNEHCLLHGSLMPMLSVWHSNRAFHSVDFKNAAEVVVETGKISYDIDQKMSVNASMNLSFVYNRGRRLAGMLWLLNFDSMSEQHNRLSLYTVDSSFRCFFGIRF